jgi:hypothetical protein
VPVSLASRKRFEVGGWELAFAKTINKGKVK